jgi:hypothetical protein
MQSKIGWETTQMVKFWLIGTEGVRSTYNSAGNMVVSIIANGVSLERQLVDFGVGNTVSRRCLVCDLQIRDFMSCCVMLMDAISVLMLLPKLDHHPTWDSPWHEILRLQKNHFFCRINFSD